MKMSVTGVKVLVESEGFKTTVYPDQAGLPTIGVGHLLTQSENSSGKIVLSSGKVLDFRGKGLSRSEVTELLQDDLPIREKAVADYLGSVELQQHQFDALVHFVFNVGAPAFGKSTLLKRLKSGDFDDVPKQLRRWNKVTHPKTKMLVASKGLMNRRETEVKLWLGLFHNHPDFNYAPDRIVTDDHGEMLPVWDGTEPEVSGPAQSVPIAQSFQATGVNQRDPWWLRLVTSKINWVAGLGLSLTNTVIFGGNLTPEQIAQFAPLANSLVLALVMFLRTFLNNPK